MLMMASPPSRDESLIPRRRIFSEQKPCSNPAPFAGQHSEHALALECVQLLAEALLHLEQKKSTTEEEDNGGLHPLDAR